ncbi:MAG: hypothetical protein FWG67_06840 [Defluviitaleaceae bacterium]|nr:hypothetical protein [Defluviitaleaceae bacterium]
MTYEKFEHKVIGMLLEGDDPKLEQLITQTLDMEVLSRDETKMSFNVKFLVPSYLAIDETEGKVFGLEVQLSDYTIAQVELIIRAGLINELKGTYTLEMSYAEVIAHYHELTFAYANGQSSELDFQVAFNDPGEVLFVKNISTITRKLDANLSKVKTEEKKTGRMPEKAIDHALTDNVAHKVLDEVVEMIPEVEEDLQPEPVAPSTVEEPVVDEEARLKQEILGQLLNQQTTTQNRVSLKDYVRHTETSTVKETEDSSVRNAEKDSVQRVGKKHASNFGFEEVLDGKAPQGPVSVGKDFLSKESQTEKMVEAFEQLDFSEAEYEPEEIEVIKASDVRQPAPKAPFHSNFKVENQITADSKVLESLPLSAAEETKMNYEIARMEQRSKEVRLATLLIVLGILCLIAFFIVLF